MSREQKLRNAISDFIVAQCDFSAKELGFDNIFEHRKFIEDLTSISEKVFESVCNEQVDLGRCRVLKRHIERYHK